MANINGTNFNDNNTFNGGAFRFSLIGTAVADLIRGFGGNDILDGRGGDDQLFGDSGNDRLIGGSGNDSLSGGSGNDNLLGGSGFDFLDGGAGADSMDGGNQDDTYVVDSVGDVAAETVNTVAGGLNDFVFSTAATHTLGFGIEDLQLGGVAAINGTGNSNNNDIFGNNAANTLSGDAGDDTIFGFDGNDTIFGGTGNDYLVGGLGNDILFAGLGADDRYLFDTPLGATNVDLINGFFAPVDTIELENFIFSNFAPGAVAAANFRANATGTAVDANDYLVYNTTNGELSYDFNGGFAGGAQVFVILSGAPPLSAADFLVI